MLTDEFLNKIRDKDVFNIGDKVRVNRNNTYYHEYKADVFYIVGIQARVQFSGSYQYSSNLNYSIATREEIDHGYGEIDGWRFEDLELVEPVRKEIASCQM